MSSRRPVRAAVRACVRGIAVCIAVFIALLATPVAAQQKDTKKLDKAQLQDAQALTDAVDAAIAGGAASSDIPVKLDAIYFFKAQNGQTYAPFTAVLDGQLGDPSVAFALRVIKKGAAPVASESDKKNKKPALPPAAFQNGVEFPVMKVEGGHAILTRAFQVPGGDYDVYVGIKERNPADKAQKGKLTVCRQEVKVPDLAAAELTTSTVVVSNKIDALTSVPTPEQRRENPYALGVLQIEPKFGTVFAKADELNVFFQIYNAGLDAAKKPDVVVDYVFYLKQSAGETPLGKAEPNVLNASTLDPAFNGAVHMLQAGRGWPLATFKPGEYRLEIKVTDKVSGKSLTHNVSFSVA